MTRLLALLALIGAGLGLWAPRAQAHSMPNSAVYLDVGPHSVRVDAILPWAELKYALPPAYAAPRGDAAARDLLRTYALAHLGASAPDGRAWTAKLESVEVVKSRDHADVEARLLLTPPAGAPVDRFLLRDDAVIHVVMSHVILVFARNDYRSGAVGGEPRLVAVLQNPTGSVALDLPPPAKAGSSFGAAFLLGMRHIAGGTDHLLFLFTLLLPAPLLSRAGRWQGVKPPRQALLGLLSTVTAFTVGHSLTLLFGALLDIRIPQQPVEVAIAASILFAAIAAWRPLLLEGRAGVLIAGGFGLVHGMSFAAAIGDYLLSPLAKAWAVLGFNLGIEVVQALVVLAVAPVLLVLARTRAYPPLRLGAAAASGAAALGWMAIRLA